MIPELRVSAKSLSREKINTAAKPLTLWPAFGVHLARAGSARCPHALCRALSISLPKNKTKNMGHMSRFINAMFIIIIIVSIAMIISSLFFGIKYFV